MTSYAVYGEHFNTSFPVTQPPKASSTISGLFLPCNSLSSTNMKRLRHYFLVFPTQCCFYTDPDTFNPREKRANPHFFLTDSVHKKSFSNSSLELESLASVPKLILEVRDSPSGQVGKTFQLTPAGVKESTRIADGKMMIGSDKRVCDIVLEGDEEVGEMHCVIEFQAQKRAYYLKDLGDGNGTFIKIEDNQAIATGDIVHFGDSHARVMVQEQASGSSLTLQFYEGPLAEQECSFRQSQQPVSIGRMKTCTLSIDDLKLSISHCFLTHDVLSGWMISDGDGSKRSANGTW